MVFVEEAVMGRVAVCRCLRRASRSTRSMLSIAGLKGSSVGAVRIGVFRSGGDADASAYLTVPRPTPYLRARARMPSSSTRASLRMSAKRLTLFLVPDHSPPPAPGEGARVNCPGGSKSDRHNTPTVDLGAGSDRHPGLH